MKYVCELSTGEQFSSDSMKVLYSLVLRRFKWILYWDYQRGYKACYALFFLAEDGYIIKQCIGSLYFSTITMQYRRYDIRNGKTNVLVNNRGILAKGEIV